MRHSCHERAYSGGATVDEGADASLGTAGVDGLSSNQVGVNRNVPLYMRG